MKRLCGLKALSIYAGILLFLFYTVAAFAAPVDLRTARQAGENYIAANQRQFALQRAIPGTRTQLDDYKVVDSMTLYGPAGDALAYLFNLEPDGFVIFAADTEITPVIAYSLEAKLDFNAIDESMISHLVQLDMGKRQDALPHTATSLKEKNQTLWRTYLNRNDAISREANLRTTIYGPLMTTTWHQGAPYNNYCPIDPTTGKRCVVGCVATAMAQVMNYHQYPSSATFTATDNYVTDTRGISINAPTATFSNLTYPANDTAAARLSYACGVAVEMNYTSEGSGASTSKISGQLTGRFGYSDAVLLTPYSQVTWAKFEAGFYTHLANNMKTKQPSLLTIYKIENSKVVAAHEIVCDGFNDTNGMYHLNYGWGSSSPTPPWWYSLPTGMPAGYSMVVAGVLDIDPGNGNTGATAAITSLSPVNNATCGSTSQLSAQVKNNGSVSLPATAALCFYIYGTNWQGFAGFASVAGLSAGNTSWYSYDWAIPGTLPAGDYVYLASIYDTDTSSFISEWSTTQSFRVSCGSQGALTSITSLKPVDNAACGLTTQLGAQVKNNGRTALPATAYLIFYVVGDGWQDVAGVTSIANLAAGASSWYYNDWTIPSTLPAGNYIYLAFVYDTASNSLISELSHNQSFTVSCGGATGCSFNEQFTVPPTGWTPYGGDWQMNQGFWFSYGESGKSVAYLYNKSCSDFSFEARFQRGNVTSHDTTNANRLIFRASGTQMSNGHFSNEYTFQINRDGSYSLYKIANGTYTTILTWKSSSYINTGSAWNVLKVTTSGNYFMYYINDHLVATVTDNTSTMLSSGKSGFGFYVSAESQYTNFWADYAIQKSSATSKKTTVSQEDNVEVIVLEDDNSLDRTNVNLYCDDMNFDSNAE